MIHANFTFKQSDNSNHSLKGTWKIALHKFNQIKYSQQYSKLIIVKKQKFTIIFWIKPFLGINQ